MMNHTFQSRCALWLAALLCAATAGAAQSPLEPAIKALDEGLAEVAILRLQQVLTLPGLEPEVRPVAKLKLAEAQLLAGHPEEALRLARDPEVKAPLLEARILAAAEQWNEALALYEAVPGDPKAVMGKAECLRALGRLPEAVAALEGIAAKPPCVSLRLAEFYLEQKRYPRCVALLAGIREPLGGTDRKWKQYLEAQLLLKENQPEVAYNRFEALYREPQNVTAGMIVGATFGMTETRTELTGLTAADDILEKFIWKHPESPLLAILFRKLDEVYSGQIETPPMGELQKWTQREPALRAGYATYYLAKMLVRDRKNDPALRLLSEFSQRFPKHPLLADALLMQGRLFTAQAKYDAAQKALDEAMRATADADLRAEIEMAAATAHFKAGEFVLAATLFRSAGEHHPALAELAGFNAALSWLNQGNYQRFAADYAEFSRRFPASSLLCDLMLEEGLLRARQGDAKAEAALQGVIQAFPKHPLVAQARLALAELRYAKGDASGANQFLRVINNSPVPAKTAEQSAFLAIFVADAANPPDHEKVIALCRAFLEREPDSPQRAEVRMKLGQVFFRTGDFASAQTQFETISLETPTSPLVEAALFLAGESSIKRIDAEGIDHAIELFSEVAERNEALKFHARLQLALLQNRLGKEADAVKLYDDILRANPPGEVKSAALAGKADNLFALGAKDKGQISQAIGVYEQLANEPGIDSTLKHRALYNKARCLETLDRPDEALAAYYQVVESGVAQPREYFWFYKAGFDACRLSEKREQWKSAIAIYQKMAAVKGPRAEEAGERLRQLRLEHFIWE